MVAVTMDILLRRERELVGALSEVQGLIAHIQHEEAMVKATAEAEKKAT